MSIGPNVSHILADIYISFTPMERKLRMPQIQGSKGEAVVIYCEPLATKEMGYHPLSRRGNKEGIKSLFYHTPMDDI
jgi:hypothetical protein